MHNRRTRLVLHVSVSMCVCVGWGVVVGGWVVVWVGGGGGGGGRGEENGFYNVPTVTHTTHALLSPPTLLLLVELGVEGRSRLVVSLSYEEAELPAGDTGSCVEREGDTIDQPPRFTE